MKHYYNMSLFIENKQLTQFMDKFDLTDRGNKCFGKFIDTTLEMLEPMTDERLQKMISIMKTEDACLHLVIFNGELVFNDEEYLMLSDGRKWLCTKNLEIRNGI